MANKSRNEQNFIAMTVIYNELLDFTYSNGSKVRDARDLIYDLIQDDEESYDYIFSIVSYSINNYGKIVNIFTPHLINWSWDRLPLIIKSILITSYAHKQIEQIDNKIIINVAVNLAKKYFDEKNAKFVNAILDEVLFDGNK